MPSPLAFFYMSTAILVDGEFFLKRFKHIYPKKDRNDPSVVAETLYQMVMKHAENDELYRVFYYDCPPLEKKVHNPITGKSIDFSKTNIFSFRVALFNELRKRRKFALRLGVIHDGKGWLIKNHKSKDLLSKRINPDDLAENDVYYDVRQKGVDIKIGIDIASISLKKQANKIILISGDSDFVPAAKLARREGVDFLLDPLWNPIKPNLFEHIDGLNSVAPKPGYLSK